MGGMGGMQGGGMPGMMRPMMMGGMMGGPGGKGMGGPGMPGMGMKGGFQPHIPGSLYRGETVSQGFAVPMGAPMQPAADGRNAADGAERYVDFGQRPPGDAEADAR